VCVYRDQKLIIVTSKRNFLKRRSQRFLFLSPWQYCFNRSWRPKRLTTKGCHYSYRIVHRRDYEPPQSTPIRRKQTCQEAFPCKAALGFGGADRFAFLADQSGIDTINDFDIGQDIAILSGFADDFNPLDHLTQGASGTVLDLGGGNSVLFFGKLTNEFSAGDFQLA
jgi:hypothetical protein